jgi:hypothetical protein
VRFQSLIARCHDQHAHTTGNQQRFGCLQQLLPYSTSLVVRRYR